MSHLECAQCLETMETPTTLPCGHSFCRDKCLLVWQKSNSTCPICREPLPPGLFRVNYLMQQAIDAMNQTSTTTQLEPEPELCPNCEDADATLFCKDCDVSFCQDCSSEVHQMKVFQSHHPVPISLRSELSLPRCPHHKGKTLSYFCTKCKVAFCDSCNSDRSENNSHSLHQNSLIPFTKAREFFTKQANELQTGLTTASIPLVEYGGKVLNLVKETIEENQSIIYDLIGDLIWQSQSKIQQIDSCNVIEESINFDENVKVKAEESISRAIDSLQKFKTILNTCLNDLESKSSCFQINLLREILGKEIIDVNALNISKRAQLVLFMVQVDPEYLPSIEQSKEFLFLFVDKELKKKLVLNFVNNSKLISTNDLGVISNLDSNPFGSPLLPSNEFELALSKIEFNTLDENQFVSLINYSIKYSNSWLLGEAIDHYEFNSLPDVFTIPTDLLLNLNLSKSLNKNKEEWVEKVIVKNCSVDTIGQLCQQLLGRESKYNFNQIESIKTNPFGALPFVSSESKSFSSFPHISDRSAGSRRFIKISQNTSTKDSNFVDDENNLLPQFSSLRFVNSKEPSASSSSPFAFGSTSTIDNKESVSSFTSFGVTAPSTNTTSSEHHSTTKLKSTKPSGLFATNSGGITSTRPQPNFSSSFGNMSLVGNQNTTDSPSFGSPFGSVNNNQAFARMMGSNQSSFATASSSNSVTSPFTK
ncbi:hypothetical protein P9112_010432 [Eukaryota sp. TZLM1-RC]